MKIHTEGAITVCKIDKGEADNKWGEKITLIISGHKSVIVGMESIIVNGVDYHARITYIRDKENVSRLKFVSRNDQLRKAPSQAAKNKIYALADKIMEESHDAFPNLFLMADRTYFLDQVAINNDKAAELEKQAANLRTLNKTLEEEQMVRSKYYNKIIGDRINKTV